LSDGCPFDRVSARGDIFGELASKRYKRMAREAAAFNLAEIAVPYCFQDLRFGPQDRIFRLRDISINHGGEGRIFLLVEAAWLFELGLAFYDPGIGCLPAVEGLYLAVDDRAAFFDDYLACERLRAVFASPFYY
jgi:hypothetical protein